MRRYASTADSRTAFAATSRYFMVRLDGNGVSHDMDGLEGIVLSLFEQNYESLDIGSSEAVSHIQSENAAAWTKSSSRSM